MNAPNKRIWWLPLIAALVLIPLAASAEDQPPKFKTNGTVDITAHNMDLSTFLETLSQTYKLNIVAPKDITGKVSVNFHDVAPLDALRTVLEANGYSYTEEKTTGRPILKIIPIPKIEGVVPIVMQTFQLNYATAADVAKVAAGLLTKNGSVTVASGKNAVVVQDVAETIQRIDGLVKVLDAAPRQVMIDAKIVELSKTDLLETGLNWSMFQSLSVADITAETSYSRVGTWTDTNVSGSGTGNAHDVVTTTGTNIDIRAGILSENNATLILSFFDTVTNSTIISRPSIRTIDNRPAHIMSGQIVPIPLFDFAKDTGTRTLSGFQDEQIGIELTVTPHINEDGYITLEIVPKVESIDRFITVGGDEQRPVRNTRLAETTIRIKDGSTAVIGGLTSATTKTTVTGLPWLKDLPIIGALFRKKVEDVQNSELIIFITPKTVKETEEVLTEAERKLINEINAARILKPDPTPPPAPATPPSPAPPTRPTPPPIK